MVDGRLSLKIYRNRSRVGKYRSDPIRPGHFIVHSKTAHAYDALPWLPQVITSITRLQGCPTLTQWLLLQMAYTLQL